MVTTKNNLFRQKALERASSPEQLDQVIQLVRPQHWLPLAAFGSLMVAGITWSLVGRIPVTVAGQGVLLYPSTVMNVQSLGAGQLSRVNVKVGDFVKEGAVLATLAQPERDDQLRLQQMKLAELQTQSHTAQSLQTNRSGVVDQVVAQRRRSLQHQVQLAQRMMPKLKSRIARRQWLQKQGATSSDDLLKVEQEYLEASGKATELTSQLRELDTKRPEQIEKDYSSSTSRQNQIQEVKRAIAQLNTQRKLNGQIIAQKSGQILELAVTPGQIITAGTKVATLEARESSSKIVGLSFFDNGEGKQIQPGMKVEMTPTSVQRERFECF